MAQIIASEYLPGHPQTTFDHSKRASLPFICPCQIGKQYKTKALENYTDVGDNVKIIYNCFPNLSASLHQQRKRFQEDDKLLNTMLTSVLTLSNQPKWSEPPSSKLLTTFQTRSGLSYDPVHCQRKLFRDEYRLQY